MENLEKIVLTELKSALVIQNPVFYDRPKRKRETHGLCFTLSGRTEYVYNGKTYVSDRGHAVLIPRGATYLHSCTEAGEFPLINFLTTDGFAPSDFTVFEIADPEEYMEEFRELERIALLRPKNGHLKSMRILYSILLRLYKTGLANESRTFHIIRSAVRYLEDHYADGSLTNSALAEKAMISEVYFRRVFKENFGVSPKQYIQDLRIAKAKNLLKSNVHASIAAVAEAVGFSNIYQFSTAFKKATGYTPTHYVKLFGGTEI